MYQFSRRELDELKAQGWNMVVCENEDHMKAVKDILKGAGHKARCGFIRKADKSMVIFVVTDRPMGMKGEVFANGIQTA